MHERKKQSDCIIRVIKKVEHYETLLSHHSSEHIKSAYRWINIGSCVTSAQYVGIAVACVLLFTIRSPWALFFFLIPISFFFIRNMIDADQEGKLHMEAANNYISVRNDIRFFLKREIKHMDEIEALARLGTITNRVKGIITCDINE